MPIFAADAVSPCAATCEPLHTGTTGSSPLFTFERDLIAHLRAADFTQRPVPPLDWQSIYANARRPLAVDIGCGEYPASHACVVTLVNQCCFNAACVLSITSPLAFCSMLFRRIAQACDGFYPSVEGGLRHCQSSNEYQHIYMYHPSCRSRQVSSSFGSAAARL